MKCGVVVFPGSNCDHDVYHVLAHVLGQDTCFLWHGDNDLKGCELVVLPGGFAHGDYLRGGAMAALSPVMSAVRRHANGGGLVLGICNGLQVLAESGLLPGALLKNRGLRFQCEEVTVRVERTDLPFTRHYRPGQLLRMPIAHSQGCYYDSEKNLLDLERRDQVVFRYVDEIGQRNDLENVNGSANSIAGLCNREGNVLALMPHPERCAEAVIGNVDGLALFSGLVEVEALEEIAS